MPSKNDKITSALAPIVNLKRFLLALPLSEAESFTVIVVIPSFFQYLSFSSARTSSLMFFIIILSVSAEITNEPPLFSIFVISSGP